MFSKRKFPIDSFDNPRIKIFVFIFMLFGLSCSFAKSSIQIKPATIGLFFDLSGQQASLGRPAMNGFLLAIESLDFISNPSFLSINNTRSNAQYSKKIAQSIIDYIDIGVGFTDNDSVNAVGNTFSKANRPFISVGATSPLLDKKYHKQVFLIPFSDSAQAQAAAQFGKKRFGTKAILISDTTSSYTRGLKKYFSKSFENVGGKLLLQQNYPGGCDLEPFAKALAKVKADADFIYLAALPQCVGKIIDSLRKLSIKLPIIGGDGLDTPKLLQTVKLDNVYYTTHAWLSYKNPDPAMSKFLDHYKALYGHYPTDAFSALGFDAAYLLVDALRRAQKNNISLYQALENTQYFHGLTGTITYSKKHHVPLKTIWIIGVKASKKYLAQKVAPSTLT